MNVELFILLLHISFLVGLVWLTEIMLATVIVILITVIRTLLKRIQSERVLNYFATSLYGKNTIDDVMWDIAKNCISKMQFKDCVIYLWDRERNLLIQFAAYGDKNPKKFEILNRIEIEPGEGIVGTVALTGRAEIIKDTSKDSRYIVDDKKRLSEITVPILLDNDVFGVIDSEHPRRNFFTTTHLHMLTQIARICSEKISKYVLEEKLRSAIARDLHDEIGSTLTSINILSKVAIEEVQNTAVAESYLRKIKEYSTNIMEGMSDIIWAINPANDHVENMLLRMKVFAAELLEPLKIVVHFTEEEGIGEVFLPLAKRKDLYLIFKEAITNIAKYSKATEVTIAIKKQQGVLELQIINNGTGFDTNITYTGNGLINMQHRAKQMNGHLHIHSLITGGTNINLQIPLA